MALAIEDGVLYNDADPWVDYYVLNAIATQVYLISLDGSDIVFTESVEPEDNPQIKDSSTNIKYYLAITDGVLWLDDGGNVCTIAILCARIEEVRLAIESIETNTTLLPGSNWKAIT